jgi:hypothetical protein
MNANKDSNIRVHSWFGVLSIRGLACYPFVAWCPKLVFKPKAFLWLIGGFDGFSLSLKSTFCLPSRADPGAWRM